MGQRQTDLNLFCQSQLHDRDDPHRSEAVKRSFAGVLEPRRKDRNRIAPASGVLLAEAIILLGLLAAWFV